MKSIGDAGSIAGFGMLCSHGLLGNDLYVAELLRVARHGGTPGVGFFVSHLRLNKSASPHAQEPKRRVSHRLSDTLMAAARSGQEQPHRGAKRSGQIVRTRFPGMGERSCQAPVKGCRETGRTSTPDAPTRSYRMEHRTSPLHYPSAAPLSRTSREKSPVSHVAASNSGLAHPRRR